MNKFFHSFLLVISLLLIFIFGYFHQKEVKRSGHYQLDILTSKVEVRFDEYAIPHIQGDNLEDTYKVFGYIMASERLFQMDLFKRLVRGELSEVFGEKTIDADILMRKLQIKKSAEKFLKSPNYLKNEQTEKLITSFLEGVHYYIDHSSQPVEFDLLGYKPSYFDISDIYGMSAYMSLTFAEGIHGDVFLSEMLEKLPEDKMSILRIGADTDFDYQADKKVVKSKILENLSKSLVQIQSVLPLFQGSNSWVLAGHRTKSGKPILANDPHIGASNPHIFYEAHIKVKDFEIYGNFIPLIPFAIMGHTPYSAWGITMAEVDDLNIYQEKIDPQDPSLVMYKNEWVKLEKSIETIKVKDAKNVQLDIITTPHGPLIDETKYGAEGKNLSLSWSVYHPDNNVIQSFYELPYARTIDEFKKSLSYAGAPGLNISWVNNTGDIVWWVMGKFPKLPEGVKSDLVLRGWDGKHEIERYYTFDENPHLVNPPSGVIVTANYRPQQTEFSHFDGYWQPGGRYFRIEQLLSEKLKWDIDDLKKIQTDDTIPNFQKHREKLIFGLEKTHLSKIENEVLELFRNWDGRSDLKSVGSSIFHMWNYYVIYNIFVDEMGDAGYAKFAKTADFWHSYLKLLNNQSHSFWDNISTSRVESGEDIITLSFKEAIRELENKYGIRPKNWEWGKLHTATYVHALGKVKPLDIIFNIGPIPSVGGRYVINNLGHNKELNDFSVVHGPATRRLIDMANTNYTYGIFPTGNSGNPMSKFFSDQSHLYHAGEYRYQLMDWEKINQNDLLEFRPK